MAINNAQPVRQIYVRRGTRNVLVRHGKDDGGFVSAGEIVVEDDGNLRVATQAETQNYYEANAADAARQAALDAGLALKNFPTVTSLAEFNQYRALLEQFLRLMFKEVFD